MIYSVASHVKRDLYKGTQYRIRQHPLKRSETICFSDEDLLKAEWKEEKEFTLNGFSYDVIKVNIVNGKKYFFCYIDKKDIIINSLVDFSKKLATKKKHLRTQIGLPGHKRILLKTSNFFTLLEEKELKLPPGLRINTLPNHYHQLERTHYLPIIIPPPESGTTVKRI